MMSELNIQKNLSLLLEKFVLEGDEKWDNFQKSGQVAGKEPFKQLFRPPYKLKFESDDFVLYISSILIQPGDSTLCGLICGKVPYTDRNIGYISFEQVFEAEYKEMTDFEKNITDFKELLELNNIR